MKTNFFPYQNNTAKIKKNYVFNVAFMTAVTMMNNDEDHDYTDKDTSNNDDL